MSPFEHESHPRVEAHYCIPDEQEHFVPRKRRAPVVLPSTAPLPKRGDVVYLSSSSAWLVTLVIHAWRSPTDLHIQIWLEYAGPARYPRELDFSTTQ